VKASPLRKFSEGPGRGASAADPDHGIEMSADGVNVHGGIERGQTGWIEFHGRLEILQPGT
jgi:hypothetical protein